VVELGPGCGDNIGMSKQRKKGWKRIFWTENEKKFLCDNYGTMPSNQIAEKLNRTINTVRTYARIFKVQKRNISNYSDNEIAFLIKNYKTMPLREIMEELGRSKESIEHKAMRLGVTVKKVAKWKYCCDCGKRLPRGSLYNKAKRCLSCSKDFQKDENHPNWKGGVSSLEGLVYVMLRPVWGKPIMKRDNYTCRDCGSNKGYKEVHHVRLLTQIRDEVRGKHPELDISIPSDKKKLAILIVNKHKLEDGKTVCKSCHKKIHTETSGEFRESPNVETRATLSQASEGIGPEEGATTMRVSPNNNLSQERPACLLKHEEIVSSAWKHAGA